MSVLTSLSPRSLPPAARAEWHDSLGQAYQLVGDFKNALTHLAHAATLYLKIKDSSGATNVAMRLGDMNRQLERFTCADESYAFAEVGFRRVGQTDRALDAACGRALALRGLGRYGEAVALLKKCEQTYGKLKDREGVAYANWAIGTTLRFAGQLTEAERRLRLAVKIYTQLRSPVDLAYAQCGLGGTLRMRGHYPASRELYARANRAFRRAGDRFGTAYSYCGQSNALRMMGRVEQALPFMRQAERIYRSLGQQGPLAFVLWSQAQVFIALRQPSRARAALREARRRFDRVQDQRGLVYCSLGEGELARSLGRADQAARFFQRAKALAGHLKLALESAHTASRLNLRGWKNSYRKCGVKNSFFRRPSPLP